MTDKLKQDDIEEFEEEIADPDDIEAPGPEATDPEDPSSLLPAVAADTTIARMDPLTAYLNEIRRYEGLSEEEEHALATQFHETGDTQAAYRLTTSNLMLVVRIALTFRRQWQNMMDLIQEGNVGLMKAVKNFDPFRGVRLSSYATWWIRSYILKYLLDNWRLVRVGTTNARRKLLYNLRKEKERLERQGFAPTTKLLAEHFGVEEEDVIDVQASLGASDVSVDTPTREDGTATPLDTLSDSLSTEYHIEQKQFLQAIRDQIESFKGHLKPIEQEILEDRVLSETPRSLQEIGDDHHITREAVRQTEQRILKKFKAYIEEHMPDYSA